VDRDLAETLSELERKLHELERALTAIAVGEEPLARDGGEDGSNGAAWEEPAWEEPASAGRLVDEATESHAAAPRAWTSESQVTPSRERSTERRGAPGPGWAGEQAEPPATPAATATAPPDASAFASAQAPSPRSRASSPPSGQPPSAAELLHFRDRLERTARELTHDYDDLLARLRYTPVPATSTTSISFARGAPSLDIIDVEGLRDAAVRAFENDPGGTTAYGTSVGYPRLRNWIAERHGVEPERVLVTNGSMQADAFLFDHLVRPRDEVIVERPTYDRTLLSLQQREARIRAVKLQPDGIDTDALSRLLAGDAGARPTLAHIIPNFQNPAGATLSLAKRGQLLALADQYGFVVFEDDPYVALRFSGESLPTMLSMDPDRVVYASSFSKTVCPGIRVGYLVGPPTVIDAVGQLATNTYISPNMVAESIVYEFCASGAIERSIETVRAALAERCTRLADALRRELRDAEFVSPEGGYFMWVTLPVGTDVQALQRAAAKLGVSFVKGTDFMLKRGENTLRLAYAGVTPDEIDEGVARIAAAYRSL
jgi:DNA-binding transcriptional MocR family regulator